MNKTPPELSWSRNFAVSPSSHPTPVNVNVNVVRKNTVNARSQERHDALLDSEAHYFSEQPVSPRRRKSSLTPAQADTGNKTKGKREELKRIRSSKKVASSSSSSSPKEDVSNVAATPTAANEVLDSPRRNNKSSVSRSKSGPTTPTRSPRSSGTSSTSTSSATTASKSASTERSPLPRSKSSAGTRSPLKAARRSSATTREVSPFATAMTIKPPRGTTRRASLDARDLSAGVSSSAAPTPTTTMASKPHPRGTPARRGSVGDCDLSTFSTLSTTTPTSHTSSTKSSANSSSTPPKKSPKSSPTTTKGGGTTTTAAPAPSSGNGNGNGGKSKYVMAPRRFSLPVPVLATALSSSCDVVDDDVQTVYTEVDFDDVTIAERVPQHFLLLEEPSTTTTTTIDDDDLQTVQQSEQRVPQHFMLSDKPPSNKSTTTTTENSATQLQRHFDCDSSSGASANRIDAATVFTEVDFGAATTTKLEKNHLKTSNATMQKARLLDITDTVQLRSIEGQQQQQQEEEGSSSSNLLGGKCRRRNSTTVSTRKTKVVEQDKKKQPRRSSMSEDCFDKIRVWNDHEPNNERDNHHQRKQVMSELVVTQREQLQQKRDRARIHRQGMDELMTGAGGDRKTPAQTLTSRSAERKQVMSELVVTQREQQQQKQERARARNHRKGMDEIMTGGGGKKTLTPTRKLDLLKTAKRPPTPPRHRERLPPSPQKRSTSSRELSVKQPMLNEKVAFTLQPDNQPMLNEKVAITLQADNHRTHEWGPDAFPGNNLEYEEFADNKVEYQKGNRTTDYDGFFSDSDFSAGRSGRPLMRDPSNNDLNASFKGLGSFLNQNSREKDTDLDEASVCIQRLS